MPEVRQWDGQSYDRISGPMEALGLAVLDRLQLDGDETVLDAGCGSGRITETLIQRLPHGRVIAVDASSESMVAAARERLGPDAGHPPGRPAGARAGRARRRDPLDRHVPLDRRSRSALPSPARRAAARRAAESRSAGERATSPSCAAGPAPFWRASPMPSHFRDWQAPWNYANAADTEARLRAAGFASAKCWLAPAPTQPEHPREFLSTIVLGPHVQHLPESLRDPFMDEVMAELGEPVIVDYVRLNIDATA
jgi:trans-aconitate 2-methyltransferase